MPLATRPLERLAVTLYFAAPTGPTTYHTLAAATSYRAAGDHRFDRDGAAFTDTSVSYYYLSDKPGVRTVIVSEATNDLVPLALPAANPYDTLDVRQLVDAHRELIRLAHARGVQVAGGTVLPDKNNPYGVWTERGEAIRDALNHWIRTSGEYDAVVDLARAVADPADPDQLNPRYDGGDMIHPNDAGYRAMADAIELGVL